MDQSQALKILVEGVLLAQSKGIYTLEQSSKLLTAIKSFEKKKLPTIQEHKCDDEECKECS